MITQLLWIVSYDKKVRTKTLKEISLSLIAVLRPIENFLITQSVTISCDFNNSISIGPAIVEETVSSEKICNNLKY